MLELEFINERVRESIQAGVFLCLGFKRLLVLSQSPLLGSVSLGSVFLPLLALSVTLSTVNEGLDYRQKRKELQSLTSALRELNDDESKKYLELKPSLKVDKQNLALSTLGSSALIVSVVGAVAGSAALAAAAPGFCLAALALMLLKNLNTLRYHSQQYKGESLKEGGGNPDVLAGYKQAMIKDKIRAGMLAMAIVLVVGVFVNPFMGSMILGQIAVSLVVGAVGFSVWHWLGRKDSKDNDKKITIPQRIKGSQLFEQLKMEVKKTTYSQTPSPQ